MYLRLVLSFVLTSPKFLHKALSRAYTERECMSLRSAPYGQLAARKSQHIIFEPPPSRELYSRASGGVCRSRACQLNICSTIYKTPYNIFTRAAAFCGRFCVEKVTLCLYQDQTEAVHINSSSASTRRRYTLHKQSAVSAVSLLIFR